MKRLILLAALALGCGEPNPALEYGTAICEAYGDACGGNADACVEEWLLYAGHERNDRCAQEYLVGRRCQAENACTIPGVCGDLDPATQMLFCATGPE